MVLQKNSPGIDDLWDKTILFQDIMSFNQADQRADHIIPKLTEFTFAFLKDTGIK